MAELVLATMTLSAMLYALFGGADFGAGMVDFLLDARVRERVDVAIAPVWEANHVWLILVVVLGFVGFPAAYATVSTLLHIPIAFALLGIVARGSAFTFRHYDPEQSGLAWYNAVFRIGSVLTPLCLGLIVSALASGRLSTDLRPGFYAVYIAPWNTLFGWSCGLFFCTLFAFEGAALLAAEHAREAAPLPYLRLARRLHLGSFVSALLVGVSAYADRVPWLAAAAHSPTAIGAFATSLAVAPAIGWAFERGAANTVRIVTGVQLLCVTTGFFAAQFPVLVRLKTGDLRFPEAAAPSATLRGLCWALVLGLALILPALSYLILVYKRKSGDRAER